MNRLIPKHKKEKKIFFKQQGGTLTQQRAAENQRHNTLAKHYVQHPTLPNLAKAAYHWWKGIPGLGGQFENDYIVQSGIAPMFGLKGVPSPEAIKKAEAIATSTKFVGTSSKINKTIKNAEAMEKGIVQATTKRLTRSNLKHNQEIQSLRQQNPDYERQYNKIARKLFMTDDPKKIRDGLKQIQDLTTLFKKGL